jgi:hypothetical protein
VQAIVTALGRDLGAGAALTTAASLARIRATLRTALNAALRHGLIAVNPACQVGLPPATRHRAVVWNRGPDRGVAPHRQTPGGGGVDGLCGIKLMRVRGRTALNLFYRLDPAAWGNSVATEAATAVVDWTTARLPGQPVVARVHPGNAASLKVAARAGLRRAPQLDTAGDDGLDWIFVSNWPEDTEHLPEARP